jgi:hypothetical protein
MAVDPEETPVSESISSEMEENYYAEVEKHFVILRGSPLFITSKDVQLIHNWRQMQIPLRVVKEGLSQVFDRKKPSRQIKHLSYCRQTVEAAYRRHREALTGATREADDGEGDTHLQRHLVHLEKELRNARLALEASHSALAELSDRSAERLAILGAQPISVESFQEIENELGRMDEDLIAEADKCLEEAESRRCMDDSERSLEDYRARMPVEVYNSAVRSAYLKRVRAHFGLPALSLFYI